MKTVRTIFTVEAETYQLECVRCRRTKEVDPSEVRDIEVMLDAPKRWKVNSWRSPQGWHEVSVGPHHLHACPDCWPAVERAVQAAAKGGRW